MKIALLGSLLSPHVKRWARSLSSRGLAVHVYSLHNCNEPLNEEIELHQLPHPKPLGYLTNGIVLKKMLQKELPDIVHSFYALGYGTLGSLSGFEPHILSVMGSDIYDDIKNPLLKPFVLNNVRKADVVCSTSRKMALQIEMVTGVKQSSIEYTPFGIDIRQFTPALFNRKERELVFGTVKFLEDKYGIDVLIKGYALFRKENPEIRSKLVIVGDGSKEYKLRNLTSELGISKFCSFEGYQPHHKVPEYLKSFDVYLALSRFDSESFGVAILEASAMELPVIVSDTGGLPEVVVDRKTGIVVNNESPEETAAAMKTLAKDTDLRLNLGNNGRKRVEKWYNWEHSVDKMISIYDRIVSTSSKE